ncbi:Ohr family peroxiredoxin [Massilia niastensis]|uniref:Ohr family peroxiredoxin n=1 Tax=Massilia niastensis TaxID=544911 RepID=UPI00036AF5C9|nr:Ohr family peroxiredoxin [Massilia niastensis]
MHTIEQVLYTGKTRTVGGGRDGVSRSDDGRLDVQLTGFYAEGPGTNPEQLLAAGWSACFLGAIRIAAGEQQVKIGDDVSVDTEVDLAKASTGYVLQARMNVSIPNLAPEVAQQLVDRAHATCPYSKALHGNINISTRLV